LQTLKEPMVEEVILLHKIFIFPMIVVWILVRRSLRISNGAGTDENI
jgi:hypothetical protein